MIDRAERWFTARTFHHSEYEDIARLVDLKEKAGLSISVCLPTLNEVETVGPIVREVRSELMERNPLVDQLAVIDSRSTDGTVEAASEEGAEVYFDDEILPEEGKASGKGEALWKSLFVLSGDLVIWIDSDIKNFHPRFVYGVAGPLLEHPEVGFVKGFTVGRLQRGLSQGFRGGRVTELTVRPLLNLFYPELSYLIQPLSGEYGGRREILESVPFFTGYGVETGLILDIYRRYGLEVFAQVDLDERVHQNQPLHALSKMAFAIVKAFFTRAGQDYGMTGLFEGKDLYNMFLLREGRFELSREEVLLVERRPMIEVPEYRKARGLLSTD